MKIRSSFVSNSSSSSFVLGKYFMTEEQIEDFREWIGKYKGEHPGATYICEGKHYFYGNMNFAQYDEAKGELGRLGIDREYYVI